MKAKYCPDCGAKIIEGDAFCGACGTKVIQQEEIVEIAINHCTSCEYSTQEDEQFCPNCGAKMSYKVNAISDEAPILSHDLKQRGHSNKSKKEPKKSKTISAQKSNSQKRSTRTLTIGKQPKVKKKGGVLRLLGKLVLGAIIVLIVGSVVLYNMEKKEWEQNEWANNEMEQEKWEDNKQEENRSELPSDNKNKKSTPIAERKNEAKPILTESKSIKQVARQVEEIFKSADTVALKQILTETSLETYDGVFSSIEPYMGEYAKAFKNRKLEMETSVYSLYSFKDDDGGKFTVEFSKIEGGVWKLVRF